MNDKTKNILRQGRNMALGGLACLMAWGMTSCYRGCERMEKESKDFLAQPSNVVARIMEEPQVVQDFSKNGFNGNLYLWDIDRDGVVDAIGRCGESCFLGEGKKVGYTKNAVKMSPELTKLVSDYAAMGREVSRKMYEEKYGVALPALK